MINDNLANALSNIWNAEKVGKETCIVRSNSKTITKVLTILKDNHYLGDFKIIDKSRGGTILVNLIGKINRCGVIKPRFSVKWHEFEKYEKRFIPAKGFGFLIISTSSGLMIHTEAKKKKSGGKLLAYCY